MGEKGKVGRPRKLVKAMDESDDGDLMGDEIEVEGDELFEGNIEETIDTSREASRVVKREEKGTGKDGKSPAEKEDATDDISEKNSLSQEPVQKQILTNAEPPEPHPAPPYRYPQSEGKESTYELVDLDDLYSWEIQ